MKKPGVQVLRTILSALLLLGVHARGANVDPGVGYTNGFTIQPPAADWATFSSLGAGADVYDMDADVNANITASGVTAQTLSDPGNPATQNASATWSSSGLFLQTRPTGNRYTALMGNFVNNTGSNATQITISYQLTIAAGGVVEDAGLGTRVYFSLTGLADSWTNVPALNNMVSANGSFNLSANVALDWPNGGSLYLMWVDDNATQAGYDAANEMDNFSLLVTAATPLSLACALNAPANDALMLSSTPITASAAVGGGTGPYKIAFYMNSGVANPDFGSPVGDAAAPPYDLSLGALAADTYNIFATATDVGGDGSTAFSTTNTFTVVDPLTCTLTDPANDASFDITNSVEGTVTVSGGTPSYVVLFYLDNAVNGTPVMSEPYSHSFGPLLAGDHTIKATVTDAKAWTSNSLVSTVHVTGPLAAVLTPTNGASFIYGQSVTLTSFVAGGTAPYTATFYTNGVAAGTLTSSPFATNLGILPVGSYTCYVHATDSSIPTPQQFDTSPNLITILPNPLVATLTSPTNGQTGTAGSSFTVAATATVTAPLTVSQVEFFLDGGLAAVDSSAPFSISITGPSAGLHSFYARATDNLGRQSYTATNQVTFNANPLANDNFANRIPLSGGSVTTTGNNTGATTQNNEPTRSGTLRWGTTLWWSWTAPVTGPVTIDTIGSGFNTVLVIYTGSAVNALTQVALNDNAPGYENVSLVTFTAQQGTQYQIQVGGARNGFSGYFTGPIQLHILMPASVAITAPASGSIFIAGSNFVFSATASTPNGSIARVDFYGGTTLFGSDDTAPYSIIVSNAPLGTNSLRAVATDSAGLATTSAVVNVLIANLGITITSPADGAIFQNTNPITVSASAFSPSGSITNVEFFVDEQKFGEDATAPFSAVWNSVSGGLHRLTAAGRDNSGNLYTSAPVFIAIAQTLMPTGSVWKYLDTGTNLGTAWIAPGFDDSYWASGPAELGYGDEVDGRPEATVVGYGPDLNNKYITTYFRRAFVITNAASYSSFTLNVKRDDGAVVYFNGQEAARLNMNPGPVNYLTFAPMAADDGSNFWPAPIEAQYLVEGANVCAVEIHQNTTNSSDISFDLGLVGIPKVIRDIPPVAILTSPANNAFFLAPASITLSVSAHDDDGAVTNVEFYADNNKLGETTASPYTFEWASPPLGPHTLQAVATDDQGVTGSSAQITITVYDALGTPLVQLTGPPDGLSVQGPTNLLLAATAIASTGVTNVQFLANGSAIGNDATAPYSLLWNAAFGSNSLLAVASDANGLMGTSAPVTVTITSPPSNSAPPFVVSQLPAAGAILSNLTSIQVLFSETVIGVNASDLLINGVAATNLSGSGSNYTFSFRPPALGTVTVTWQTNHGITDIGWPSNLTFDAQAPGATWTYALQDRVPPVITSKAPTPGTLLANLTQITVLFSKAVTGVNAADLLINGIPAFGLTGSSSLYIFAFSQPGGGTVNISWAANHGITDLASPPNPFDATGPGATWTYTLDPRTTLVQSNANWMLFKGTTEASVPIDAWRQRAFDDSWWSSSAAPFFYGDTGYTNATYAGTTLSDMQSNYTSVFLRKTFVVNNAAAFTNLLLYAQSDDGFIAWINGVEVLRYNMPGGDIPYNGTALGPVLEPYGNGAAWTTFALPDPSGYLLSGTNILAVQAFNESLDTSTDFGFNAQLYTYIVDLSKVAPRIASVNPPAGEVLALTNITVRFSEPVSGVDAGDLLINGMPAGAISSTTNTTYTFGFSAPAFGSVQITWAPNHGIQDLDSPPKDFDATAPGSTFSYSYINVNAPVIALQSPAPGATLTNLAQIVVTFSEPVSGIDASDLLVNDQPATSVAGGPTSYTFSFAQLGYGLVAVRWATNCAIHDLAVPPNDFDPLRPGNTWFYNLVDKTAPVIATVSPPASTVVLDLTQVTVIFSEPVTNVNASDLLIDGVPARNVIGSGATYTFGFPQPETTLVTITWAAKHGICDLAPIPNSFDATRPGATWSYVTPDTIPPRVTSITPLPGATLPALSDITVTFSEPVAGLDPLALLMNDAPARAVSGSGNGPYLFQFAQPQVGTVQLRWNPYQTISDLALPPNPFPGGEWTYQYDPNASFAGKVVLNEIMYAPASGLQGGQWLELYNTTTNPVNLAGWRFTKGVDFAFPSIILPGEGCLVVAADLAAFNLKYPGVSNVIGGWTGGMKKHLELKDAAGNVVNDVNFSNGGEWGERLYGSGEKLALSVTRSGSSARVTYDNYSAGGDTFVISGADQPEYNGTFSISSPTYTGFNYTVSGTPVSPATGTILVRQITDWGKVGWAWSSRADGLGSSLELIDPYMPNAYGQNWRANNLNGTPGRFNTVRSTIIAPLISEVQHFPLVPRSTNNIIITARISASGNVTLWWRVDALTPPAFGSTPMYDDGMHGDGLAGDGVYGAVLPAQPNNAVIEFYVQVQNSDGTRTWPAPALDQNRQPMAQASSPNALLQVDNNAANDYAGVFPVYKLILRAADTNYLVGIVSSAPRSDATMNMTFICLDGTSSDCIYLCEVRDRGNGTRSRQPANWRIAFPGDHQWRGLNSIELNTQYTHAQLAGYLVSVLSGVDAEWARVVKVRFNNYDRASSGSPQYSVYIQLQSTDHAYALSHFPEDPDGNLYRAQAPGILGGTIHVAGLNYLGSNWTSYANQGYSHQSGDGDWSDLMNLCAVLNTNTPDDAVYAQAVRQVANVEQWMRFMAVFTLILSRETSFATGQGDDYSMYGGVKDPRFRLLGHDFDTVFNEGDTTGGYTDSIWRMVPALNSGANTTVLNRFMRHPDFAPCYFRELKRLSETVFSPVPLNYTFQNFLGNFVPQSTINNMVNFSSNRVNYVLSQIPLRFTVNTGLGQNSGYYYTITPTVTLNGQASAIDTRSVTVNGASSLWSAWEGRWTNTVNLQPGINHLVIESRNTNGLAFASTNIDVWYDRGASTTAGGSIFNDTVWTAANGPYNVTSSLNIASDTTLTIQPGTTVYFGSGVNITVANGGRLLAEGTFAAPIRFTRTPGSGVSWGGITINGAAGSPETRLSYVQIEFNGTTAIHSSSGTLYLDHLTFGTTLYQYFSLDSSSFIVQNCVFPTPTAAFEPGHGTGGVKSGGHGIFLRNFFGAPNGYNDVVDFTGGNRPGQPIVQFIDNVFAGSGDDVLDLDGTDAWVEGNIFLHIHKNGSPDTSSGVSGGDDSGSTSEVTILNNIFYDCDQAAMCKQGNFFTLFNNTVVHQTHIGGLDTTGAVVCVADAGTVEGRGMYLEGNILYDVEDLVRNQTAAIVTFTNNLMSLSWAGPGANNTIGADPLFNHLPQLSETYFTNWESAQVMKDWLSLRTGSPASGTGPNGLDKGAVVPLGVAITGEPDGATDQTTAALHVGINRTGSGIPAAGWPDGSGYTHYKWRLDGGSWSAETAIANPIVLTGLEAGPHQVAVVGMRDTGVYQDDPINGVEAAVSYSRAWMVDPNASSLHINEILAWNNAAVPVDSKYPDLVELYNSGPGALDLSYMTLTDDPSNPAKFIFPPGASVGPDSYLILYADNDTTPAGYHLGFALNRDGDDLYLFSDMGQLLDSVTFGPQLPNLSIGRLSGGTWGLTVPTFGAKNQPAQLGNPRNLRINEWLTDSSTAYASDFLELYNTDALPVSLGGLYLTDTPIDAPDRHQIPALSFIAGNGYAVFNPDGDPSAGPQHLKFKLAPERGEIALFDANLGMIDYVLYGPQRTDISQGRSPNASTNIAFFTTPTPGSPNPAPSAPGGLQLLINEVLAKNTSTLTNIDGGTPSWIELYNPTANPIVLADMSLTDNPASPRKYVLPPAQTIASGGYLVVLFDPSQPASSNSVSMPNTGFGIPDNGGQIYLYEKLANGGSLLDSIAYGVQANDFSVGRQPSGSTNWMLTLPTPGSANLVATTGDRLQLRLNEWMAAPGGGSDWFEIYNPNPQPVVLSGLYLTDDLSTPESRQQFQIAPLSFIGAGLYGYARFWADKNQAAGPDHVTFALSAQGEELGITAPGDAGIDWVTFPAQVSGVSEGRLPDGSANIVRFPVSATPGDANYLPSTNVVVNEVLSAVAPNSPFEQAIELRNISSNAVDISGWYLSNMKHLLQKYQFADGSVIPPGGYWVVYANELTASIDPRMRLVLDAVQGDQVYLSATDANGDLTGYRSYVKFGAVENGVSFGRYVTSDHREEFVAMSARTFGADDPGSVEQFRQGPGAPNAYPRVGPVVVSQIMYHPPKLGTNDNIRDEFIELHNITTAPVPLYDPAFPTNVWHLRDAVDFNFPLGTQIPAGGYLLVVSFDPWSNPQALAGFRQAYQFDTNIPITGPYSGKLANDNDEIELRWPGTPQASDVPYILLERVHYFDAYPWPPQADGTGMSLHRKDYTLFANDLQNWTAAAPTEGAQAASPDYDHDGMLDAWEIAHGLDPFNPWDANLDSDNDGMTNLQEFQAGTDPRDPQSLLRFQSISLAGTNIVLTFIAASNVAYTIQYTDAAGSGAWNSLQNIDAAPTNRTIQVTVPATNPARFYRLRTPALSGASTNVSLTIFNSPTGLTLSWPVTTDTYVLQASSVLAPAATWQTITNGITTNGALKTYHFTPDSNTPKLFFHLQKQ